MEDSTIALTTFQPYPDAAALEHVSDAVVVFDRAGHVRYANPAALEAGEAAPSTEALRLVALAVHAGQPAESMLAGRWRRVIPTAAGEYLFIGRCDIAAVQINAQMQAEARIQDLFEHAPMDMLVLQVPPDGVVMVEQVNAAFCRTTGLTPEIAGRSLESVLDAVSAGVLSADVRICVAQGGFECQHMLVFPVGQRLVRTYYRTMPGDGGLAHRVLLTQVDVTETRRIEVALRQALRLEVVGQLTGGVAHDFNNLLTAVLGSLELLNRAVTEPRQLRWIQVAAEAAQRGAALTQQLLSYARKQFMEPTATDIPEALSGMTELLRGSLGGRIILNTDFDPRTWLAHTDIAQLELTLLNLMVNARAAMPEGGVLTLTTHNHPHGAPNLPPELEVGGYVVLTVADTGTGMPPDVLRHAMEPFFTTKGVGEGSGLGLSQAYGFARQSGGTLRLTSKMGAGTVAEIFLPRAVGPSGEKLRLLLVDEDEARRQAVATALRQSGWAVDEAPGAGAALEGLGAASYAVMLVDLEMSSMSGLHLARRAMALQPKLRPLFLTTAPDAKLAEALPGPMDPKSAIIGELIQAVEGVFRRAI